MLQGSIETRVCADAAEINWIDRLSTHDPERGYNMTTGGVGTHVPQVRRPRQRREITELTRQRMSLAASGRVHTNETKEKLRAHRLGKTMSLEAREKTARASTERFQDESFRSLHSSSVRCAMVAVKERARHARWSGRVRAVVELDSSGDVIARFDTTAAAAAALGVTYAAIRAAIKRGTPCKGRMLRHEETKESTGEERNVHVDEDGAGIQL